MDAAPVPDAPGDGANDAWFFGDDAEDGAYQGLLQDPAPADRTRTGRPRGTRAPRIPSRGVSITALVACLSVLLVLASAAWYPQVP
ncbi:hypothetical protein ACTIVE_5004 [Actinomadura verrucosospora]|uniref:Uncharacterized protein n=1 Tax=Actinomadura verrucosospora TaxID=46165 RepID=A0A7D3ZLV0_ACTVE|nr:hypothetical protein ACTIVE_5004 [Actinomadura verrucosospora]